MFFKSVGHVGHAASFFSGLAYFALLEVVLHPFLSWFWLLNASTLAISLKLPFSAWNDALHGQIVINPDGG